jgi:16S rRNA (adenine1518-N6/adenine1519-N6)-dimethyltransferase
MHVQTKTEIGDTLARIGIRPRKRFGQHFLIDGNLMRRLVESAGLEPGDTVIEVGCGTGGLTDLLLAHGATVIGVEIDRDLAGVLEDRFGRDPRFTLIRGDALERKHVLHAELVAALERVDERHGAKLVANLPYQVASPLLLNLLVDFPVVRRLCFTVQAEVGERITARPGTKTFGPLGILCQALGDVEPIARIGPQSFWPRPEVQSVMLRLDVKPPPLPSRAEVRALASLVRGTFEHRRKKLRSALAFVADEPACGRVFARFDPSRRPESLTVDEWVELFTLVVGGTQPPPREYAALTKPDSGRSLPRENPRGPKPAPPFC